MTSESVSAAQQMHGNFLAHRLFLFAFDSQSAHKLVYDEAKGAFVILIHKIVHLSPLGSSVEILQQLCRLLFTSLQTLRS